MNYLKSLLVLSAIFALACAPKNELAIKDVAATRALYKEQQCITCHGEKGEGGIGPSFKAALPMSRSIEDLANRIGTGSGQMPSFKDKLSQEQIQELAKFVYKEIQGR